MTVPAVTPAVEIGPKAYFEQVEFSAKNVLNDSFKNSFMEKVFSHRQTLMGSSGYAEVSRNELLSENYKDMMKQFRPVRLQSAEPGGKSDQAVEASNGIMEYTNKIAKEIELQTMNQLVFSVSTRFSSSINQLVRGQ